jgi:hypothetical protein
VTHRITFYANNTDFEAFIRLGLKLGRSPGLIDLEVHNDSVNDLVGITLEFASKEDATSFGDDLARRRLSDFGRA